MHDAGAVGVAHIIGQIQGGSAVVAVFTCAAIHVARQIVQRMAEHLAAQHFALGCGQNLALAFHAKTRQAFFDQIGRQQQHALGGVDQGVVEFGVGIQRLVGRNGPGRRRPDNRKGLFACRQGG